MAVATALRGFNDLGHSATPKFLSRTVFIYNYLHIIQKWTKTEREKFKKIQDFCPRDMDSAIFRLQVAWNYGR